MIAGAGGNITVSVGLDGVLLVDSGAGPMADKVVAEKRAADLKPLASTATIAPRTGLDIPAILLMSAGGGLILGGTAMNFTVVEPAYAAISEANAHPGTMTAEAATAWEGRFDIGRTSTIAMIGAGLRWSQPVPFSRWWMPMSPFYRTDLSSPAAGSTTGHRGTKSTRTPWRSVPAARNSTAGAPNQPSAAQT